MDVKNDDFIINTMHDIQNKIELIKQLCADVILKTKQIEKHNACQKKTRRKKREVERKVSQKLANFMNLSTPSVSRENVLRYISNYVIKNNLQIQSNKRNFKIDKQLSQLLNLEIGTIINFLSINKYINHLIHSE